MFNPLIGWSYCRFEQFFMQGKSCTSATAHYSQTSIKRPPIKRPPSIKRPLSKVPNYYFVSKVLYSMPLFNGQPLLSGQFSKSPGWPLNRGAIVSKFLIKQEALTNISLGSFLFKKVMIFSCLLMRFWVLCVRSDHEFEIKAEGLHCLVFKKWLFVPRCLAEGEKHT